MEIVVYVLGLFFAGLSALFAYSRFKSGQITQGINNLEQKQQQANQEIANKDGQLEQVQKQIQVTEKKLQSESKLDPNSEQIKEFFDKLDKTP